MGILGIGPSIVLYNMLPSILAALVYFLLGQFFIFVFRIKKPSRKFLIYFIVLYKTLLSLLTGARYSYKFTSLKPFIFGFRFSDPLRLLPFTSFGPMPQINDYFKALQSPFLAILLSIILITLLLMFILRWAAMVWFLKRAANFGKESAAEIQAIIKNLSAKLRIGTPKLVVSEKNIGPLVIGIAKPTIILPEKIVGLLSEEEITAVIGHELAHIKRKDNLWQWLILFMKDLLFFNPIARLNYNFLQLNKEVAADYLFVELTGDKPLLEKTLQKVSLVNQSEGKIKPDLFLAESSFLGINMIDGRLAALRMANLKDTQNRLSLALMNYAGLLFFLWLQMWIAINVSGKALLLLS